MWGNLHIHTWKCKNLQLNYSIWTPPGRQNVDWPSVRFVPLSCSMLLSCDVASLWHFRNYINEGETEREQHLFGPKYQNAIINSESKPLFCKVGGGDNHWALYGLPVVTGELSPWKVVGLLGPWSTIRRYTPVRQCHNDAAECLRRQRWLQQLFC